MFLFFHAPPPFFRFSAKSIARCGVFWVFLIKPWSNVSIGDLRFTTLFASQDLARLSENFRGLP